MNNNNLGIKLILFDIGNVLVNYDSTQLCVNLNEYSQLADHNFFKIKEYLCDFGVLTRLELGQLSIDDLYIDLTNRFNMHWDIYDFTMVWTKELRVNMDMKRIVSLLSDYFDIGVLSNIDILRYRYILDYGMLDTSKIKYAFLSYIMNMVKPDIRIANHVSKYTMVPKSHILFIDDKDVNVKSMRAEGIRSIEYINPIKLKNDLRKIGIEI